MPKVKAESVELGRSVMMWEYAAHSHAVKLAGGPMKYDMRLRGQGALLVLGVWGLWEFGKRIFVCLRGQFEGKTCWVEEGDVRSVGLTDAEGSMAEELENCVYVPVYVVRPEGSRGSHGWGFSVVAMPIEYPLSDVFVRRMQDENGGVIG